MTEALELRALRRARNSRVDDTSYQHNNGLQNQNVLLVLDSLTAEPRLLAGSEHFLGGWHGRAFGHAVTDDGKLMAYGTAASGSDWQEWHVRDVDTGQGFARCDQVGQVFRRSVDERRQGIFLQPLRRTEGHRRLRDANYFHKLYYHEVGTPQDEDKLIYERPDNKELGFGGGVTDDGRYLVITVWQGTSPKNRLYYKDLLQAERRSSQTAGRRRRAVPVHRQ